MNTKIIKVDPKNPDEKHLLHAADIIRDGGLVVIPTETVYGIAANSQNAETIRRLAQIKQRPQDKHFSLHIDEKEKIVGLAKDIPTAAFKLSDRFWPGPLTMILKTPDNSTIGIRLPDNAIARRIIALADVPVVCPSANISGKVAPINVGQAMKDLNGAVDMAIDAGPATIGKESTVVDLTVEPFAVVREGALKKDEVLNVAQEKIVLFICTGNSCRSVMAEGLLKKKLQESNRRNIKVVSAGIMMADGLGASFQTAELLRKEGIDVSVHRSQRLTNDLLNKSDLILVMEEMHENRILQMAPWVKNRLFLLKEFAKVQDGDLNITDPIGRADEFYAYTFGIIKEAVERVAQLI